MTDALASDDERFRHCLEIQRRLGFNTEELDLLRVAAILHDYGKIGISDSVLKKDGVLDAEEFAHMKMHATDDCRSP